MLSPAAVAARADFCPKQPLHALHPAPLPTHAINLLACGRWEIILPHHTDPFLHLVLATTSPHFLFPPSQLPPAPILKRCQPTFYHPACAYASCGEVPESGTPLFLPMLFSSENTNQWQPHRPSCPTVPKLLCPFLSPRCPFHFLPFLASVPPLYLVAPLAPNSFAHFRFAAPRIKFYRPPACSGAGQCSVPSARPRCVC